MKTTAKAGNRLKIWEIALLLGVAVCLLSGAKALQTQEELADKVVRLHVLANSDSEEDQALKLQVRDAVLDRAEGILRAAPDRDAAEQRLRDKDKRRAAYHRFYTNMKWGHAQNYHICLDSGKLGIDTCVAILRQLY